MAKRSQGLPVKYEKNQLGCMWGFISMFDFCHGHSTRKLIAADKRHSSKDADDAVHTKNKFEKLINLDEEYEDNFDRGEYKRLTVTTGADKPSVKKLIEEEMFIDQNAMKDKGDAVVESKQSRLGCEDTLKMDSKRKKRSHKKSCDMDTHDLNVDTAVKSDFSHNQHSRQQSKDNLDLDKIFEDFCHIESACLMMDDDNGEVHAHLNRKPVISEKHARDAIHEFVNQMMLNGKDLAEARKFICSQELMEALQVISSDKELFLRLLQDPNSLLLKYVQELGSAQGTNNKEYSSFTGSNFSEQDIGYRKQTRDIVNHKNRSFFRKKKKSLSQSPTNENGKSEFSNRIVILKPALIGLEHSNSENNLDSSLDSHEIVRYKTPSMRASSHFSLTDIKKKLRHAMGKKRHGNHEGIKRKLPVERQNKGPGGKAVGEDNVGMKSPNKDHFFIEKITTPMFHVMKGKKTSTLKDSELFVEHDCGSPEQRVSNIYVEAKKHLSELLNNGDENTNISSRNVTKTLGRILSLPEYNFSPLGSPGRDLEDHFVTAQTRFSALDKPWEVNDNNLSPKQANLIGLVDQSTNHPEKQSCICNESSNNEIQETRPESDFSYDLGQVHTEEACYTVTDEMVTEGNCVQSIQCDVESEKEMNVLESSSDPVGCITGKDPYHDISEIPDGASCSQCFNQDVTEENQPSSPLSSTSSCSINKKIEELESGTDVPSQPSPVSVLDTPFLEDDFSPRYSRCHPVKPPARLLQIQFEEHESSPVDQFDTGKYCLEENELIYDYIKAVLQASGLTRDQLLMKCLNPDNILDPSLFDQVEYLSNLLCHDQKLLFDCIEEVLMEICLHYFGPSPWLSVINPSIRPTPNMKKVILKVWEGVCWHILPLPPPHTLEQLVRKDTARSGTWMDLRFNAETLGFEMGDAILVELMEDAILSCVLETPESKRSLQFELKDNESSINL